MIFDLISLLFVRWNTGLFQISINMYSSSIPVP
jgi:hypothetical protein